MPFKFGTQPLHSFRSTRQLDAAGHLQPHVDTAFGLNLRVKTDRVLLQCGDMRIAVDRMESTRGMPTRTCRQFGSLDDRDVRPAAQGEVVEQAGSDDAAADDHNAVRGSHD